MFSVPFDPLEAIESHMEMEWSKLEQLEDKLTHYHVEKEYLLSMLANCETTIACVEHEICEGQDKYNELAIEHASVKEALEVVQDSAGNMRWRVASNESSDTDDEDSYDEDSYDAEDDPYIDIVVEPRRRYTRSDILTPFQAVKSCKSSKLHKLKPKCPCKDKTKMKEAKEHTKRIKVSHMP